MFLSFYVVCVYRVCVNYRRNSRGGQQIFIFILNYFGPGATRNLAGDSYSRAMFTRLPAKDAKEPRLDRNTWPQMAQISRITEGKEAGHGGGNPKPETRNPKEGRNPKSEAQTMRRKERNYEPRITRITEGKESLAPSQRVCGMRRRAFRPKA